MIWTKRKPEQSNPQVVKTNFFVQEIKSEKNLQGYSSGELPEGL